MTRGHCSGTMSPPSGARPSRRMSVKDCDAEWPRVLTYFMTSKQLLEPYADDRRGNRRQPLDAPDRRVDVLLDGEVREDHDVDLVLALARFLLEDGIDRDREIRADARHVREHAGAVEGAQPQVVPGLDVLHGEDRRVGKAIGLEGE